MGNYIRKFSIFMGLSYPDVRVLVLGLDSVGKTTILYWLKLGKSVYTIPSIGYSVETTFYKKTNLIVYDVSCEGKHIHR